MPPYSLAGEWPSDLLGQPPSGQRLYSIIRAFLSKFQIAISCPASSPLAVPGLIL